MDSQWRVIPCFLCQHLATLWRMPSLTECEMCEGNGQLWIRPKGVLSAYPGGPSKGLMPKEWYDKAKPVMPIEWHLLREENNDFDNFILTDSGEWSEENIVVCSCGWVGSYTGHEAHYNEEEKLFIESKLLPN